MRCQYPPLVTADFLHDNRLKLNLHNRHARSNTLRHITKRNSQLPPIQRLTSTTQTLYIGYCGDRPSAKLKLNAAFIGPDHTVMSNI